MDIFSIFFCQAIFSFIFIFFNWQKWVSIQETISAKKNSPQCFPHHALSSSILTDNIYIYIFLPTIAFFMSSLCFTECCEVDLLLFSFHPQVLLMLFSIIRRNFWDYGRLALVADKEGSVHLT